MIDKLINKLTNNHTEIPLFYASLNLVKYKNEGEEGSCDVKLHPILKDEYIVSQLNGLIDYIRENYDMDDLI